MKYKLDTKVSPILVNGGDDDRQPWIHLMNQAQMSLAVSTPKFGNHKGDFYFWGSRSTLNFDSFLYIFPV